MAIPRKGSRRFVVDDAEYLWKVRYEKAVPCSAACPVRLTAIPPAGGRLLVVDFACLDARLVVEADGASHFPKPHRDVVRDRWLQSMEFLVLRFPNHDIIYRTDHTLDRIRSELRRRLPSPSERGG